MNERTNGFERMEQEEYVQTLQKSRELILCFAQDLAADLRRRGCRFELQTRSGPNWLEAAPGILQVHRSASATKSPFFYTYGVYYEWGSVCTFTFTICLLFFLGCVRYACSRYPCYFLHIVIYWDHGALSCHISVASLPRRLLCSNIQEPSVELKTKPTMLRLSLPSERQTTQDKVTHSNPNAKYVCLDRPSHLRSVLKAPRRSQRSNFTGKTPLSSD